VAGAVSVLLGINPQPVSIRNSGFSATVIRQGEGTDASPPPPPEVDGGVVGEHTTATKVPFAAGLVFTVARVAHPGIRTLTVTGLEVLLTVMAAVSPNGYLESVSILPPFGVWTQFTVSTGKRSEHPRGMPLVTRLLA
jgi:hypothetical protein